MLKDKFNDALTIWNTFSPMLFSMTGSDSKTGTDEGRGLQAKASGRGSIDEGLFLDAVYTAKEQGLINQFGIKKITALYDRLSLPQRQKLTLAIGLNEQEFEEVILKGDGKNKKKITKKSKRNLRGARAITLLVEMGEKDAEEFIEKTSLNATAYDTWAHRARKVKDVLLRLKKYYDEDEEIRPRLDRWVREFLEWIRENVPEAREVIEQKLDQWDESLERRRSSIFSLVWWRSLRTGQIAPIVIIAAIYLYTEFVVK